MITSGLNVQFEQMISKMPPKVLPLSTPASPEELDCLGFRLTTLNVDFKKGFMELNCGYETVSNPRDPKKCEEFMDALRNGPSELLQMADKYMKQPKTLLEDASKLKGSELPNRGQHKSVNEDL